MPKFVIDEDMPRSTSKVLKDSGYEVKDIRDHGLRGADDEMSTDEINRQLVEKIKGIAEEDFTGNLIIIEPGKLRIRRKQ